MTDETQEGNFPFLPDWTIPPGAAIRELLRERGMTRATFAALVGIHFTDVPKLLRGDKLIRSRLAAKIAKHVGGTPQLWLRMEARYRADLVRLAQKQKGTR